METKDYNGWTNYETWNVKLWLDNEESDYQLQKEWAERITEPSVLAEVIKEEIEGRNPIGDGASMFTDLLGAALSEVNWYEIAESILESE